MHSLPILLRIAGRPVILVGDGEAADAKRRLIQRAGGIAVGEDDPAARIAVVAIADDAVAEATVARLKARGMIVNAVDRPRLCDFTWPAIVDRDPVLVAVATGGASAGLAKAVRQRIERILPPDLGLLATALSAARARMRMRWPSPRQRREAIDSALAEGGTLDPLRPGAADRVADWLAADGHVSDDWCRVETILLASADPDELTLRAARLLGEADRVIHDPAVPDAILARARADAVRIAADPAMPVPDAAGLTVIVNITPM